MAALWWWGCVNGCDCWVNHQRKEYSVSAATVAASQVRINVCSSYSPLSFFQLPQLALFTLGSANRILILKCIFKIFVIALQVIEHLLYEIPWIMYSKGEKWLFIGWGELFRFVTLISFIGLFLVAEIRRIFKIIVFYVLILLIEMPFPPTG